MTHPKRNKELDLREAARLYAKMRADYSPVEDVIMDTDPPKVAASKRILASLDPDDRAIFILYTDIGSLRKVAELLGVSRGSLHKEVRRIRGIILERYEHIY